MTTATVTMTRAEKIERWIELDALGCVARGGDFYAGTFHDLLTHVDSEWWAFYPSERTELFDDLWPVEEDTESDEHKLASARSALLAARLFERLLVPVDAEVTGTVLRRLPLARIRDIARRDIGTSAAVVALLGVIDYVTPEEIEWAQVAAREAAKVPLRRGRKGYPRDHYRRVALRAVALADTRRDVVEALREEEAKRLGRYVAHDTVKRQLARARHEFGFLAPTTKGRANFTPGPNLYRKEEENG